MEPPAAREVIVEVFPADGVELEIEGALTTPFVGTLDIEQQYERVITEAVRDELFIPDDTPIVVLIKDDGEIIRRIEQPKRPE